MSDYIGTTVLFGGLLKRSNIARVEAVMMERSFDLAQYAEHKISADTWGESAGGQAEDLCQLLVELGLSYRRTCISRCDTDGNGTYYDAATGHATEFMCSQDGEPTLSLFAMMERRAARATLDAIIAELIALSADLPPLEIVED
jgi:hypothetical protein